MRGYLWTALGSLYGVYIYLYLYNIKSENPSKNYSKFNAIPLRIICSCRRVGEQESWLTEWKENNNEGGCREGHKSGGSERQREFHKYICIPQDLSKAESCSRLTKRRDKVGEMRGMSVFNLATVNYLSILHNILRELTILTSTLWIGGWFKNVANVGKRNSKTENYPSWFKDSVLQYLWKFSPIFLVFRCMRF